MRQTIIRCNSFVPFVSALFLFFFRSFFFVLSISLCNPFRDPFKTSSLFLFAEYNFILQIFSCIHTNRLCFKLKTVCYTRIRIDAHNFRILIFQRTNLGWSHSNTNTMWMEDRDNPMKLMDQPRSSIVPKSPFGAWMTSNFIYLHS